MWIANVYLVWINLRKQCLCYTCCFNGGIGLTTFSSREFSLISLKLQISRMPSQMKEIVNYDSTLRLIPKLSNCHDVMNVQCNWCLSAVSVFVVVGIELLDEATSSPTLTWVGWTGKELCFANNLLWFHLFQTVNLKIWFLNLKASVVLVVV